MRIKATGQHFSLESSDCFVWVRWF